jgi:hypothetical protein
VLRLVRPSQSADTGLKTVSHTRIASSRATLRVLIVNRQPIVRQGGVFTVPALMDSLEALSLMQPDERRP